MLTTSIEWELDPGWNAYRLSAYVIRTSGAQLLTSIAVRLGSLDVRPSRCSDPSPRIIPTPAFGSVPPLELRATPSPISCATRLQPSRLPPDRPTPLHPTGDPQNQRASQSHSLDPNDKLAPGGFGDAAFIQADSSLAYQVRFENESTATAPARLITVTDTLDPNVDLSTFELTEIEFANQTIAIPAGLDSYSAMVPMTTPTGASIVVNVQASLDRSTRTLSLMLQALDPATGWYSEDPLSACSTPRTARTGAWARSATWSSPRPACLRER